MRIRILKTVLVAPAACLGFTAFATPDILKEFKGIYPNTKADCQECHVKPPTRNPFGKSIEEALNKTNDGVLSKAVMAGVEKLDSDGDGALNIDEINAGTLPGDPASKPGPKREPKPDDVLPIPFLPKHSLHPALVHFPLALLAVAALLEFFARRKSLPHLHLASVINLALGLISALAAIVTGILAMLRLEYAIKDDMLIHLILASVSVVVGFVAYAHREKPSYLLLMSVSGLLVLVAGHFGGNMVYG